MQVHAFTAQHAFIHRMAFIALNSNAFMFILTGYYATAYAAVAAGSRMS